MTHDCLYFNLRNTELHVQRRLQGLSGPTFLGFLFCFVLIDILYFYSSIAPVQFDIKAVEHTQTCWQGSSGGVGSSIW